MQSRKSCFRLAALLIASLVGSAGAAEDDVSGAREAIEETNERYGKLIAKGDAAGIAALYTDDGRLLPPASPIVTGPKEIEKFWKAGMEQGIDEMSLKTLDVGGSGDDTVYEVGRYTLTVHPEGKKATTDEGKYVVVWKKVEGSWKLHVDIWNSNSAAGGSASKP